MGDIKTINGKDVMYYFKAPFGGYLNREGYIPVHVCCIDTSNRDKGYITTYFLDLDKKVVFKSNLLTKPLSNPDEELPLEKLIKLAFHKDLEDEATCYEVGFDELLEFECQILVVKDGSYYNIKDVYPKDAELGEYVSREEQIKSRIPKVIFGNK
ncbi:hypothetical protein HPT25_07370 [Bacillus sp. BRMEA1]|nr:hypothetical protein [Neobacillus endophyticus]